MIVVRHFAEELRAA